jgi:N6-adenosine-specific RNA methylase IME4
MYDIILADPPWQYDNQQQNDPARGGLTYPYLSMKDLCELPVSNIAADNSLLFCWVTFPKLCDKYYEKYDPLEMIRAWGFRPLTAAFVWVKTNKNASIPDELEDFDNWYSGLGRYTNSNVEFCIVARRGKALERSAKNVKQLIVAPIGRHSAKPKEQYQRIEALYPNKKYIELFARKINPPPSHWDATGKDFDGKDIRDFLNEWNNR